MKTRIISAAVAIVIIVPLLILGGIWFYIGAGIIGIIGYIEMLQVKDKKKKTPIITKINSMISFILIMMSSMQRTTGFYVDYRYLALAILLTFIPIIFVEKDKYNIEDALFSFGTSLFLGIGFNFIITLRNIGLEYILYIAIITIMSDTFAHFWGTHIGKNKLCPRISPNKTIEGFVGGTLLGTTLGTIFYVTAFNYNSLFIVIIGSLILSIIGQCGDLVFSAIKRHYEVKDFGNIMPGHGGILDRLDSIIFASIIFSSIIFLI